MVLYALCRVYTFSLHRESPDMILGDEPLLSQGGSITVGYQIKIGVKHTLTHLKITTTLLVRNG
jgi:hypothetical protein